MELCAARTAEHGQHGAAVGPIALASRWRPPIRGRTGERPLAGELRRGIAVVWSMRVPANAPLPPAAHHCQPDGFRVAGGIISPAEWKEMLYRETAPLEEGRLKLPSLR